MRFFAGILLFSTISGGVLSALLNEPCESAGDCATLNSICGPLAFICAPYGSFCQCRPGFSQERGRCKKLSYYNEPCGDQNICANGANHLFCNTAAARCECDIGYEPDYTSQPIKCVVSAKRGRIGDACTADPVDTCGLNLECLGGTCSCIAGYFYDDIKDTCVTIGIGDTCIDDQDCFNVIRAYCNKASNTCECPANFLQQLITYNKEPIYACLQPNNFPKDIGENCVETGSAQRSYCAQPFVCTQCTPNSSVSICTIKFGSTTPTPVTTTRKLSSTEFPITRSSSTATTTPAIRVSSTTTLKSNVTTTVARTTTFFPQVLLGEACSRDVDCGVLFSACSGGICQCQDGYKNNSVIECHEYFFQIPLGQRCEEGVDFCTTSNAICVNSTCRCSPGYKMGPQRDDCIENSRISGFSETCESSNQCYYNLICLQSKCLCSLGYKQVNYYSCKKRELEDACPSGVNAECRFVSNSTCSSERYCKCAPGFTRESSTRCVSLVIVQDSDDAFREWKVPCTDDTDCYSSAAPKLSVCLRSSKTCGCPANSVYDEPGHRCQYSLPQNDRGFACTYDSDCPFHSRCIRGTCGGTAQFVIISGANKQPSLTISPRLILFSLLLITLSSVPL